MYPGPMGAVDVLLVVDNSGTMGPGQIALTQAMDSLVARLDNEGLDYRIAVTTTDVGNPWCGTTSPEAGNFVASSCRARLGAHRARPHAAAAPVDRAHRRGHQPAGRGHARRGAAVLRAAGHRRLRLREPAGGRVSSPLAGDRRGPERVRVHAQRRPISWW
jgi:hypothetical protein